MADTEKALENNRGYSKHKKGKVFLICMNVDICGSRCFKINKKILKKAAF